MDGSETHLVEVMLDMYSGRPNPRWMLSLEEAAHVRERLDRLPEAEALTPPGLGYRGIVLTFGGAGETTPQQVRVYKSRITIVKGEQRTHYEDSHGIEEWLAEQAEQRGYGTALARLRSFNREGQK